MPGRARRKTVVSLCCREEVTDLVHFVRDPVACEEELVQHSSNVLRLFGARRLVAHVVLAIQFLVDNNDPKRRIGDRRVGVDRVVPSRLPRAFKGVVHRVDAPPQRHDLDTRNVVHN